MMGAYLIVVIFFAYTFFFKSKGKKCKIVLYQWINYKRVFYNIVDGVIRKRYSDSSNEQLCIKVFGNVWTSIPDSKFFMTNMKGELVLHALIDIDKNVKFINHEDIVYREYNIQVQEKVLDSKGNPLTKEVYVSDEYGNIILEVAKDNKGNVITDSNGDTVYVAVKKSMYITKIIDKKVTEPSSHDQIIESDIKLYYLNKKEENRQKFKRDEKKSLWQTIAPIALIGIIVLMTVYLSYKHMNNQLNEVNQVYKDTKPFLQKLVESATQNDEVVDDGNKPTDYGKKVD